MGIDIKDFLPLGGVLVGSGVAFLSVWFQQKNQIKRESKKLKLEKLEAAYKAVTKINKSYTVFTYALAILPVYAKEAQKQVTENNELDVSLSELRMLTGFYAPKLNLQIKQLDKITTEFAHQIADALKSKSDVSKTLSNAERLNAHNKKIDKLCHEIQNELVKLSKDFI